ncbi:MAG: mechanosensitive ion channel family protein [Myxococcota bacterium]|nr:mechanosensitive ion channel family protein [Myxococcota bacterium]
MQNDFFGSAIATVRENWLAWLTGLAVALFILFLGWLLARLAAGATRRAMLRTHAKSLAPMMSTLVRVLVFTTACVTALDQVGFDVTTVLAGAGVLGLAIGFGAQTLVKDCISGFFMVVENVLEEGDWVDVDGKFGQVTSVGLRLTQLRAFDGTLWHVPNGEVKIVGNLSKEWVRVVATVGIAYEADLAKGLKVLQEIADDFREKHADLCYEGDPPVAQGVVSLDDSSVALRLVARVKHGQSGDLWPLQREVYRAIKERFDAEDIEIPFPRQVVYHKSEAGEGVRVITEAA